MNAMKYTGCGCVVFYVSFTRKLFQHRHHPSKPCCGNGSSITDYHAGVWLQNCNDAHVVGEGDDADPDIQNDAAASGTNLFRGIDVETCSNAHINCVTINNIPWAMRFMDNCDLTKLKYNFMGNYERGVQIEAATLLPSIMGDWDAANNDYIPYDNQWDYTPGIYKIWNDASGINWYYQGSAGFAFPYYPLPANTGITPVSSTLTGDGDCPNFNPYAGRLASIGRAVFDSLQFDDYANESLYSARLNAYKALKNDTSLIAQGLADDYIYSDFVADMEQSNAGIFIAIDSAISVSNTDSALTLLAAINDTNAVETNLKTAYSIYLNTVAVDSLMSSADSSALLAIAAIPVRAGGPAVYMAAAMLGLEVHQEPPPALRVMQSAINEPAIESKPVQIDLKVYPLPAKESIFLHGLKQEKADVLIYDVQGRLLLCKQNITEGEPIDIETLSSGFYRLNAMTGTKQFFQKKISVVK